jgi:hypothetical protein
MDKEAMVKWSKTTIIAALGGGFASVFAAAMDPAKYRFPQDFGTGKMWPFFFQGAGLMFVGLILKSPLGQEVMSSFKQSQQQLKDAQADIAQTKADLKAGAVTEVSTTTVKVKPPDK